MNYLTFSGRAAEPCYEGRTRGIWPPSFLNFLISSLISQPAALLAKNGACLSSGAWPGSSGFGSARVFARASDHPICADGPQIAAG